MPCPLCSVSVLGFVDTQAEGRLADDHVAGVLRFLGHATAAEYNPSDRAIRCELCNGLGKVTSGSRVPQWETLSCPECNGYGFTTQGGPSPAPTTPQSLDANREDVGQTPAELSDRDEWGEAPLLPDGRENPNFGRMPHRKILVEPWGITAGLTVQDA